MTAPGRLSPEELARAFDSCYDADECVRGIAFCDLKAHIAALEAELSEARDNYDGARADMDAVVVAFVRRCQAEVGWLTGLDYLARNHPTLLAGRSDERQYPINQRAELQPEVKRDADPQPLQGKADDLV